MSDTLFITCHICREIVAEETVEDNALLPPWKIIRWHQKVITHVRRNHLHRKGVRK